MKNFLRALRSAWPYRGRLLASILCACLAAVLWSLCLTVIYPVQEILGHGVTLHEWAEQRTKAVQARIDEAQPPIDELDREQQRLDKMDANPFVEQRRRDVAVRLAKLEGELQSHRSNLKYLLLAKRFIHYLPADRFLTLTWIIGFVVVGVAIKGLFEFAQESLVGSVVNLSLFDMRNRLYRNVLHLDVGNFGEEGTPELMARFTNDMELLGNGLKTLFGKLVAEPLKALGCVLAACLISWRLTLIFLVLVPIALFILIKVGRLMKRATRRLLERMSSIYKLLQETFQGIRVVKAFTMEPCERRRFSTVTRDYYLKAMWVVNLDALAGPVIEVLGVAAIAVALLAGAYLVVCKETHLFGLRMTEDVLDASTLLQFYGYLVAIADPVRKLSSVYTKLQSGAAAADRVFSLMDRRPRVGKNAHGPRLTRHADTIEFRDVCFSYEPGRPILTNIHLQVRSGETVALVGKNGCGKSTLLGLLPRFYDPDHGSVLIDGQDVRGVNLRSLRQQFGIVTQETTLFDDTVYSNLAYGNRRAKPEDVEAAAKKAFAHDFIIKLPRGYDTRIGEAGTKLSGGQRQRLTLARAILRDPAILILDEFTSQTDAESEALINNALREFMLDRTTFVITHRLNTLEIANRIVVVDNGRIVAVGTHRELLASSHVYQRLHEAQSQRLVA